MSDGGRTGDGAHVTVGSDLLMMYALPIYPHTALHST